MRTTQWGAFLGLFLLIVTVPAAPAAEGPITWWSLDGNTADAVGGIRLTAAQRAEFAEGAMVFDGEKQFLSAGDDGRLDMGMSDFTLEAVFKLDRYPKNHGFIIAKGNKGMGGFYYLACDGAHLRARLFDDGKPPNNGDVTITLTPIDVGKWYHTLASYDRDGKLHVYLNGKLAGSADISKVGDIDNIDSFKIGMLWTQHFPGKIADVRVYRRALSALQAGKRFQETARRRGHAFADLGKLPDTRYEKWELLSAAEAAAATGVTKENLLADSSFEGLVGVESLINSPRWWSGGGRALRKGGWHGPSCIENGAKSGPIPYKTGVPHTLSFYAKGAPGGAVKVIVRHSHKLTPLQRARKKVVPKLEFKAKLAGEWKRYSFSFRPGAFMLVRNQNLVVQVGGGKVFLYAFQLEQGGLTEYSPKPIELFVNFQDRNGRHWVNYFFDDDKVPLRVVATRQGAAEVAATLTVRDFWMQPAYTQQLKFKIAEGAVGADLAVHVPPLPKGSYRVYLEGDGAKARSMIFGVIGRDLREPAEIMGASHMAGLDWNARLTDDFGITWTRHHAGYTGIHGSRTAKTQWLGKDYWADEDKQLAQKTKNPKLRFWGGFYYPPAPWGRREGEEFSKLYMRKYLESGKLLPESFYEKNEEYFRAAIPRFKKTIKYWECWNEPPNWKFSPKAYFEMLKWFYKVVKEEDPEAVVIGVSGFFSPEVWKNFMVPLMDMGGLKYCDVLSYHGYFRDWPEDKLWEYKKLSEYLDTIREQAAKIGKPDMPIWDNEFTILGESWYDNERPTAVVVPQHTYNAYRLRFDGRQAVSNIVHYIAIAYAHGVRHFSPHLLTFRDPSQNQHRLEYMQPVMDYDGSIKPKGIAFAVVCHKMNDAKFAAEKIDGNLHVYTFSKPKGSLAVVFMRHGKPAKLVLAGGGSALKYRDAFDGPFKDVAVKGGRTIITLKDCDPIYIESSLSGDALAELLKGLRVISGK